MLFVIRDFLDKGNNLQSTKEKIMEDIDKLWGEIHKPDEHKDKKVTDFFELDFEMFPHKVYQEDKFVEKAAALKQRFSRSHANTLFKSNGNNVPIDGLGIFLE